VKHYLGILFFWIVIVQVTWGSWVDQAPAQDIRYDHHHVVWISQHHGTLNTQPIFQRLIKRTGVSDVQASAFNHMADCAEHGYQVMLITYLRPNERQQPQWASVSTAIYYAIRTGMTHLTPERTILKNAMKQVDTFVQSQLRFKPLCIVVHLPPKQMAHWQIGTQKGDFEQRRDFSLALMYHEIHQRRYLTNTQVIVYPNQPADSGLLIHGNN
jgi:hypothetical protein